MPSHLHCGLHPYSTSGFGHAPAYRTRAPVRSVSRALQASQVSPIIDALLENGASTCAPFHIPGHKRGSGVHEKLLQVLGNTALRHDLTELPGLDYLADPSGVIAESQRLAAATFSAGQTWFLVNGTTVGIQAAILATCGPGDGLLVARNCHMAAFSGMALAGCSPVWIMPQYDDGLELAQGVTAAALEDAFERARQQDLVPKAVLIVSPTYFGACSDIAGLSDVCHAHGVPLLVDEAHGAHLGLHPELPRSAMQQGADVAIQSTHKTLSSLGQSSMLHCSQSGRVEADRLSHALRMLQSSSPNYLLLASLDAARAHAEEAAMFKIPLLSAEAIRASMRLLPGITLLEDHVAGDKSVAAVDPWRITVGVEGLGLTGFEAETILQERSTVLPELATHKVVVFALGPGTQMLHAETLISGINDLCRQCMKTRPSEGPEEPVKKNRQAGHGHQKGGLSGQRNQRLPPPPRLSPRDAFFAETKRVPVADAEGCVSAELLCPYPPGVPIAFPGEALTAEAIEVLAAVQEAGGKVTGASDMSLRELLILVN